MREVIHQCWLLLRAKITAWWLLSVCDRPEAMIAYMEADTDMEQAAKMLREEHGGGE